MNDTVPTILIAPGNLVRHAYNTGIVNVTVKLLVRIIIDRYKIFILEPTTFDFLTKICLFIQRNVKTTT